MTVAVRVVELAVFLDMAAVAVEVCLGEVAVTAVPVTVAMLEMVAVPLVDPDSAGPLAETEAVATAVPGVALGIPAADAIQIAASRLQQVAATPMAMPELPLGTP